MIAEIQPKMCCGKSRRSRKRVDVTYEALRSLSARLETDVQRMVQQNPEVGQLLREVRQTGRPARDVIRELQEHLRRLESEEGGQ